MSSDLTIKELALAERLIIRCLGNLDCRFLSGFLGFKLPNFDDWHRRPEGFPLL